MNPAVLANLVRVANSLRDLGLDDVVFLGGATVGLLLTDPAAPEPRLTKDVDLLVPVFSRRAYSELEERLRAAGYTQPMNEGAPICRWLIKGVPVDLMPPDEQILGFSNRWYRTLMEHALPMELANGPAIRVATAPILLATKLEAFHGRGAGNFRFSHDIEDIIILLDGRAEVVDEVHRAPSAVRAYLAEEFKALLENEAFLESIGEHLLPDAASQQRMEVVLERIRRIAFGAE